ncbi:MAG TPA: S8 family serine peptidase [Thermoanaerobaculia bacterium]|nr:S8 family serine peptidase [Thermoanaerobaculia bacterium]
MRSLYLLFVSLLMATVAVAQEPSGSELFFNEHGGRFAGARHFVLTPQHVLSDAERAELKADGIAVVRAMSNGTYLARVSNDAETDGHELLIRSLDAITAERKLAPSAVHAAVSGRTYTRVNVVFNDEVTLDEARSAILSIGGELERPFATDFDLPRNLRARIPAAGMKQLATDERVFTIHGATPRIANDNIDEAVTAHVDQIQAAPYNLDGNGVVLSYFELSPADATHPEFQGRLTTHFPANADTGDALHATHTGGTMIAAGLNAQAKGMAPKATLHGYDACDDCNWLGEKKNQLPIVGSIADNNSWGYILGWCDEGKGCNGFVWTGNAEYIGAYDSTDSAIDQISRNGSTLFVHSAGNDGNNAGPTLAPYQHKHNDDNGNLIANETFCYSENGSGTDCPAPPLCSAGIGHCEINRHPTNTTVTSIGLTASAKNIVAVGATDSGRNVVGFSSRGPTLDGRVKPDITAKGFHTLSTAPNNLYVNENGTSMSAPVVTGTIALLTQQWKQTFNSARPLPVQLKALLIAGAFDQGAAGPDYTNGFGALDAKASTDVIIADGGSGKRIQTSSVAQGGKVDIPLTLSSSGNLRVVIVWTDPEVILLGDDLATSALVNDLDLSVTDAGNVQTLPYILDKNNPFAAATKGVNKVDNVEEVEIKSAAAGTYHLIVNGTRVTSNSPQQFVLVATAGTMGSAPPPCTDVTEPNDTSAQAFGIGSGQSVTAKLCAADDVDVFKFHVDKAGTLSYRITTNDAAVHAVLTGTGIGSLPGDVSANNASTFSQAVGAGDYFVTVTASGSLGSNASYTIAPTFPTITLGRGRVAAH